MALLGLLFLWAWLRGLVSFVVFDVRLLGSLRLGLLVRRYLEHRWCLIISLLVRVQIVSMKLIWPLAFVLAHFLRFLDFELGFLLLRRARLELILLQLQDGRFLFPFVMLLDELLLQLMLFIEKFWIAIQHNVLMLELLVLVHVRGLQQGSLGRAL